MYNSSSGTYKTVHMISSIKTQKERARHGLITAGGAMEEEAMLKKEEENDDEEDGKGEEEKEEKLMQKSTINRIIMEEVVGRLGNGDLKEKIEAAMAIRKLVRKSNSKSSKSVVRSRLASAGVIAPLISMLQPSFPLSAREPALLALLNLAVRNQRF